MHSSKPVDEERLKRLEILRDRSTLNAKKTKIVDMLKSKLKRKYRGCKNGDIDSIITCAIEKMILSKDSLSYDDVNQVENLVEQELQNRPTMRIPCCPTQTVLPKLSLNASSNVISDPTPETSASLTVSHDSSPKLELDSPHRSRSRNGKKKGEISSFVKNAMEQLITTDLSAIPSSQKNEWSLIDNYQNVQYQAQSKEIAEKNHREKVKLMVCCDYLSIFNNQFDTHTQDYLKIQIEQKALVAQREKVEEERYLKQCEDEVIVSRRKSEEVRLAKLQQVLIFNRLRQEEVERLKKKAREEAVATKRQEIDELVGIRLEEEASLMSVDQKRLAIHSTQQLYISQAQEQAVARKALVDIEMKSDVVLMELEGLRMEAEETKRKNAFQERMKSQGMIRSHCTDDGGNTAKKMDEMIQSDLRTTREQAMIDKRAEDRVIRETKERRNRLIAVTQSNEVMMKNKLNDKMRVVQDNIRLGERYIQDEESYKAYLVTRRRSELDKKSAYRRRLEDQKMIQDVDHKDNRMSDREMTSNLLVLKEIVENKDKMIETMAGGGGGAKSSKSKRQRGQEEEDDEQDY